MLGVGFKPVWNVSASTVKYITWFLLNLSLPNSTVHFFWKAAPFPTNAVVNDEDSSTFLDAAPLTLVIRDLRAAGSPPVSNHSTRYFAVVLDVPGFARSNPWEQWNATLVCQCVYTRCTRRQWVFFGVNRGKPDLAPSRILHHVYPWHHALIGVEF